MPEDMTLEIWTEIKRHKKDLKRAEAGLLEYKEQYILGVAAFEDRIKHHRAIIDVLKMYYDNLEEVQARYRKLPSNRS